MTNIIGGRSRAAISNRVDDISSAASQIADSVNKGVQARLGVGAKRNHGNILRYPLDLDKESKNFIRFEIVDRQSLVDKKSIYLYTPPGVSIPDAASYNQADLGIIGGSIESVSDQVTGAGPDVGQGIADITGALLTKAVEKSGTIGQAGLIEAGTTTNPFTNVAFQGTALRSFNFTFKLVAESEDEAEQVRAIENTFRKFLYPTTESTDFLLKYPPYFKIEFISKQGDEMKQNRFMPFINYSYLLNMTTTFNESTNLYHSGGQPTEVSLSLTFQESKALLRKDLYSDPDNYSSAEYHRTYTDPRNIPPQEG